MRRRVVCSVATVAAAAALLASAGCGGTARRARADSSPTKPGSRHTPLVMFLGDSYTTGRLGQIPELTYAADTARTLGWQVIIAGYRGTGFVAKGHIGKNFLDLFVEQLAWRPAPDMVIVSGGHNDQLHSPEAVAEGARQLLTTIQHTWAGTRLLVVGPMWGGDPTPPVEDVRDAIEGVAGEQHVPFIDPLRERWITGDRVQGTGNAPMYILRDGIHPSTSGARYIATRLVADLRTLKLAKP
ncbi:MAG TPA: SGNH/GDSL hydrolase family protein [Actinoallomurus sp.]|nr:SGNH/GDSL hydrolase family protein [Actinoallomurus sp.]